MAKQYVKDMAQARIAASTLLAPFNQFGFVSTDSMLKLIEGTAIECDQRNKEAFLRMYQAQPIKLDRATEFLAEGIRADSATNELKAKQERREAQHAKIWQLTQPY